MMKLTTLDNGLKVASRAMPGIETAAVGLYAEAGSRHEPARLNGIAHLFEHMVFKGAGGVRRPGARPAGARRRSEPRRHLGRRPRRLALGPVPRRRPHAGRGGEDR